MIIIHDDYGQDPGLLATHRTSLIMGVVVINASIT